MSGKDEILRIVDLSHRYGKGQERALKDVNLNVEAGQIVALVGESGSGKSTLLRSIAGLEQPESGIISIADVKVLDQKHFVAPQKRSVGMVFQEYALFPHLSVQKNISYGMKKESSSKVADLLKLVGLEGFEKRYPHELSGGEQQRVAIARALATYPKVLLLDEPFSNLDEALKDRVRLEIVDILRRSGTTAILVTHDTRDALATADQIVVLQKGVIAQHAEPEQVYRYPKSSYIARFFGKANLIAIQTGGSEEVLTSLGLLPISGEKGQQLLIRPENFVCCDSATEASGVFSGEIENISYLGAFTEYIVKIGMEKLILHLNTDTTLKDKEIHFNVKNWDKVGRIG